MECNLIEKYNMKSIAGPADLNAAATVGARVSLKDTNRVGFLLKVGAGTGATIKLDLVQYNDPVSSVGAKPIPINGKVYTKADTATVWTAVDYSGTMPTEVDLSAQLGGVSGMAYVELLSEDLDVNNGFAYAGLNLPISGAAKQGSVVAFLAQKSIPAYSNPI